nr:ABC transporter substrate-binding protein [Bifidobacterium indicum]
MRPDEPGVHAPGSATEADKNHDPLSRGTGAESRPGPSTDPTLNEAYRPMSSYGNPLPWKLLSLVLALALVVSLWTGHSGGRLDRTEGGLADSISIGLKLAPGNLDIRNQSGTALDQLLIGNVYEGLVARDSNNTVIPGLAKDWDISKDGLEYVFHLHKGMHFSNGHTLDADDVVWSLKELMDHHYQGSEMLKNYRSIERVDATTVRLRLTRPYQYLLWELSGRAGLVFDRQATYDMKTAAQGSGPYLIEIFRPNDSVLLKADPHYWGDRKPRTRTIRIRYLTDDNAAVNALRSGDVQALAPITANLAGPFRSDPSFQVRTGEDTDKFVLAMNGKGEATSDIRVRQAIRYAIDHEQLIASRGGVDKAMGGPIPSLDPGYEDLTGLFPHDPDKARQLLGEAGYGPGHPLRLRLTYANTYGTELGDQLRSQLKVVGIELDVRVVEFSVWLQDVHANKDYDLSLVDHGESHDFYQWATPTYYYNYDSPEVRRLHDQAMDTVSQERSQELLTQAARKVSEDAAADWLFNYRITTAWHQGLEGFPVNLNQSLLPLSDLTYRRD